MSLAQDRTAHVGAGEGLAFDAGSLTPEPMLTSCLNPHRNPKRKVSAPSSLRRGNGARRSGVRASCCPQLAGLLHFNTDLSHLKARAQGRLGFVCAPTLCPSPTPQTPTSATPAACHTLGTQTGQPAEISTPETLGGWLIPTYTFPERQRQAGPRARSWGPAAREPDLALPTSLSRRGVLSELFGCLVQVTT